MTISSTFVFSLSAVQAAETRQAVSANNVANVSTAGFKSQRATQSDMRGGGTQVRSIDTLGHQGPILRTSGSMDLSIAGNGFFQLQNASGAAVYSRDGSFKLDGMGRMVDSSGNLLQPPITVPAGAQSLQVNSDGRIGAVMPNGGVQDLGQIQLAQFTNPGGLLRAGDNLLTPTAASGAAQAGMPGRGSLGTLIPGALEGSNVDLAAEMVDQIVNQRAFEANIKPMRTADEMLGTLLDLKQ